jgi:hypothetical protein
MIEAMQAKQSKLRSEIKDLQSNQDANTKHISSL